MKTMIFIVSLFGLFNIVYPQIVEHPQYSYERLTWNQKYPDVKTFFAEKKLTETTVEYNPFAKGSDKYILYSYVDIIESEKIGVGLQFQKKDTTLVSIILSYVGIDSVTKEQYEDFEQRRNHVLQMLTGHYVVKPQEQSIPFMGTVRIWILQETKIQAQIMSSSLMMILSEQ